MPQLPELGPSVGTLEVSVFGPGIGECVLVHIGAGEWIVVDSCIDRRRKEPVAISYLRSLGVDLASVKLIVATHWHDDHVGGIAAVLDACPRATFACSAALMTKEFLTAVEASRRATTESMGSGLGELAAVFDILSKRAPSGSRPSSVGPKWLSQDVVVLKREAQGDCPPVAIHALSPSAGSQTRALMAIARLVGPPGSTRRVAVSEDPNSLSVVLLVEIGDRLALLGGDLEQDADPLTGWNAVLTSQVPGRARLFKVPHHGSQNADNPQVWQLRLTSTPTALVTPFTRSGLPRASDLRRMAAYGADVLCSGPSQGPRPPRRDAAVEKTAQAVARDRRVLEGALGHIRIRWDAGTEPTVELFNGAYRHSAVA